MRFDFDEIIDRRHTAALKWDRYAGRDIIPMWVADMDFRSSPAIIEALAQRVQHGVFGYTDPPPALNQAIANHLRDAYAWHIDLDWLLWLPGLVSGINLACRAIGEDGDEVATAIPVYHPFLSGPVNQGRLVKHIPMTCDGGRWVWDFERLEASITPRTRLLLLCNPHNPVGRVFTHEELNRLGRIACEHDLVIVADEIHCGLTLDQDKPHVPLATVGEHIAARTITLMAASKTFNLPGLGCAFAVVPNSELRSRLLRAAVGIVPRVNAMGYVATLAAYRDSADWHAALLQYLRDNRDLLMQTVPYINGLSITPIEATYLGWIRVDQERIPEPVAFFEQAGVGLYDSRVFGTDGYVRLNFGCPRSLLRQALERMADAVERL